MRVASLGVIYIAFVSLGLPDTVLGVAWPSMRVELSLELEVAGVLAVVTTLGTALSSFAYERVVDRWGSGSIVVVSIVLTGLALFGYAASPSFAGLLLAAVPLGIGAGAVDTGLNAYVARNYSSRHMNWLHASWGVGAFLGPTIMSPLALTNWRHGYLVLGILQLMVALLVARSLSVGSPGPDGTLGERSSGGTSRRAPPPGTSMGPWPVRLSVLTFLLYSAAEMGVALWLASYLIEARGAGSLWAGTLTALFFLCIAVGRFLAGALSSQISNRALIRAGAAIMTLGALLFALGPESAAGLSAVLLGLGCAPVFPSMVHETPRLFGPSQAEAITGYQVGTYYLAGVTLVPSLGLLAQNVSLEAIPLSLGILSAAILLSTELMYRWVHRAPHQN